MQISYNILAVISLAEIILAIPAGDKPSTRRTRSADELMRALKDDPNITPKLKALAKAFIADPNMQAKFKDMSIGATADYLQEESKTEDEKATKARLVETLSSMTEVSEGFKVVLLCINIIEY